MLTMFTSRIAGTVLVAVSVAACGGTVRTGEMRHETAIIDLEQTDSARVELSMSAGDLIVKGGTPKFVDAAFTFNVDAWKPVVEYHPGSLSIKQPSGGSGSGRTENRWDVKLTDQIPLDVVASLGAGDATLELGGLNLRNVNVNLGAGDVTVDLTGEPKRDYSVSVLGGVGDATVKLPKNVAISATARGGIGDISTSGLEQRDGVWINPDNVGAPVTVTVSVSGGVGSIRLTR